MCMCTVCMYACIVCLTVCVVFRSLLSHIKSELRILSGLRELDLPSTSYQAILSVKVHPSHTKLTLDMRSASDNGLEFPHYPEHMKRGSMYKLCVTCICWRTYLYILAIVNYLLFLAIALKHPLVWGCSSLSTNASYYHNKNE